jgi:hypothetical protein
MYTPGANNAKLTAPENAHPLKMHPARPQVVRDK